MLTNFYHSLRQTLLGNESSKQKQKQKQKQQKELKNPHTDREELDKWLREKAESPKELRTWICDRYINLDALLFITLNRAYNQGDWYTPELIELKKYVGEELSYRDYGIRRRLSMAMHEEISQKRDVEDARMLGFCCARKRERKRNGEEVLRAGEWCCERGDPEMWELKSGKVN